MEESDITSETNKEILIEKIKALPVTVVPVNHWEGTKYKPYTVTLVKLDDVVKILQLVKKLELE